MLYLPEQRIVMRIGIVGIPTQAIHRGIQASVVQVVQVALPRIVASLAARVSDRRHPVVADLILSIKREAIGCRRGEIQWEPRKADRRAASGQAGSGIETLNGCRIGRPSGELRHAVGYAIQY